MISDKPQVVPVQSHTFVDKNEQNETKPLTAMPFGVFKGVKFEDIAKVTELKNGIVIQKGKDYLKWINGQEFVKQNLKDAIQKFI